MIPQILPTPGSAWRTSIPSSRSRSGWPMPESSSNCGELIEPALTTTSRAARASRIESPTE